MSIDSDLFNSLLVPSVFVLLLLVLFNMELLLLLRMLLEPGLLLILTGVTIVPFANMVAVPVEEIGNVSVVPNVPLVTPEETILELTDEMVVTIVVEDVMLFPVPEEGTVVTEAAAFLLVFVVFSCFTSGVFDLSCLAGVFLLDFPDGVASPNKSGSVFIPSPSFITKIVSSKMSSASKNFSSSKSLASIEVFVLSPETALL